MSTPAAPDVRTAEEQDRLRRLAESGAAELGWDAPAEEVVAWVAKHVPVDDTAVACSMADAVLPHVVAERLPRVDVLFLDTGYHFTETLATRDEVGRRLDVNIVDVYPELTIAEQDAAHGPELFARDPGLCCGLRKVDPLNRVLSGYRLWFTGVPRGVSRTSPATPRVTACRRTCCCATATRPSVACPAPSRWRPGRTLGRGVGRATTRPSAASTSDRRPSALPVPPSTPALPD
jgi:3'-phosphoadenosine 5'-phosphosulfate sulfotransferase (PAPS reductase)/FAD synthetase